MSLEFPIEPTDTFAGVMATREHRAEAKSIETFFNPRSVAVIGASRRQDTIGQALVRHLVLGDYTGRVYVVNDRATSVSGMPAHATVSEIDDDVDVAIVAVPADVRAGRRPRLRQQGRARPGRDLVGLRRDRRGGPPAPAPAARAVPLLRPAADRAQLPRHHQHRPRGPAQRLAVEPHARPRPRRLLLPVRRARLGDPREGHQPRPRPLDVRQRRQPRRRLRQRRAAVLGGGRRHRGRAALPRVDRQPAQVLPHRPPGLAAQADHRRPLGPHHPGRADGPDRPPDRGAAARGRRDVPAGRGDPGRHPRRDVRRRPAAGPPAAAARAPGRDRRQQRRHRAARRRRRVGGRPGRQPLGRRWAPTRRPRTSRTPSTPPSTTPRSTRWSPSTCRRSTSPARTSPTCSPRSGEQSDKPIVSSFLGAEGVPELLRVPDVAGSSAGRGSVPSYPAIESAVRALASVVGYAVWLRTPNGPAATLEGVDPAAAKAVRQPAAHRPPRRPRPRARTSCAPCWPATASTCGALAPVSTLNEALQGRQGPRLGRRAQGHHRPAARAPRPRPRVAQHRHPGRDAPGLAHPQRDHHRPRVGRVRGAEERPARHPGDASPRSRTRCSARWCRSASPGR